ncbi:hypothetical protein J7K43_08785 [Candidatus Calescamantes bacterium]|nr:hypothetical protein [Candidatus Calescamantes bacterium]
MMKKKVKVYTHTVRDDFLDLPHYYGHFMDNDDINSVGDSITRLDDNFNRITVIRIKKWNEWTFIFSFEEGNEYLSEKSFEKDSFFDKRAFLEALQEMKDKIDKVFRVVEKEG